jgi:hypothetical protein
MPRHYLPHFVSGIWNWVHYWDQLWIQQGRSPQVHIDPFSTVNFVKFQSLSTHLQHFWTINLNNSHDAVANPDNLYITLLVCDVCRRLSGNVSDENTLCKCHDRLVYGFDYLGNTCGDKKASVNLKSFEVRYWQNPNQVYKSGVLSDPFNLADARSICLKDCPSPSNTNLTWICDYPQGPINLTMDDWAGRNYDYYDLLTTAQQSSSTNLTGPCYPVLFQSTNCKASLTGSSHFSFCWINCIFHVLVQVSSSVTNNNLINL